MYWTLELASKLEDAPWPATKEELIDYAIRSGAPQEVIENLNEATFTKVSKKFGQIIQVRKISFSTKTNINSHDKKQLFRVAFLFIVEFFLLIHNLNGMHSRQGSSFCS